MKKYDSSIIMAILILIITFCVPFIGKAAKTVLNDSTSINHEEKKSHKKEENPWEILSKSKDEYTIYVDGKKEKIKLEAINKDNYDIKLNKEKKEAYLTTDKWDGPSYIYYFLRGE